MKRIFLLLIMPLLMATTCDEDEISFITDFYIQNDSSIDLIIITEAAGQILIESQSKVFLAKNSDITNAVIPSGNHAFNSIKLYKIDHEKNLILAYEQDPIINELWHFNESSTYDFKYTLVITDDLID